MASAQFRLARLLLQWRPEVCAIGPMALGFSSIRGTENSRRWFTGQHYGSREMGLIILIFLLLLLFGGGGWGYSRYGYGGGIGIGGVLLIILIVYLLFGYGTL
jgi:hypothetical protein